MVSEYSQKETVLVIEEQAPCIKGFLVVYPTFLKVSDSTSCLQLVGSTSAVADRDNIPFCAQQRKQSANPVALDTQHIG